VTILHTVNYGLAYADTNTPLVDLADVTAQVAATVDAALTAGGVAPPGATDLIALAGRVSALEAAHPAQSPRIDIYRTAGGAFGGAFLVPYDAVRTAQTTPALASNTNAWFTFDPANRRILIKQAGLYRLDAAAQTTDGTGAGQFLRILKVPTPGVTTGDTIAVQALPGGFGAVGATERLAAGEYVGAVLNTAGSDQTDAGTLRNHLSITRLSS
jgi:hypothetical protein